MPPAATDAILLYRHADCLHRAAAAACHKNPAEHATCSSLTVQLEVFISLHEKQTLLEDLPFGKKNTEIFVSFLQSVMENF